MKYQEDLYFMVQQKNLKDLNDLPSLDLFGQEEKNIDDDMELEEIEDKE